MRPLTAWRDRLSAWLQAEERRRLNAEIHKTLQDYRVNPGNPDEVCARCGQTLSAHAKVQPYESPWTDTPRGPEREWEFRLVCPDGLFQSADDAKRERAAKQGPTNMAELEAEARLQQRLADLSIRGFEL